MTTITAVELRERLEEIIDLINKTGEEIILSYRGNKKIRLVPFSIKRKKSRAQLLLEKLNSKEYTERLKRYNLNMPELDEQNPHQEKLNIRKARASKYEK